MISQDLYTTFSHWGFPFAILISSLWQALTSSYSLSSPSISNMAYVHSSHLIDITEKTFEVWNCCSVCRQIAPWALRNESNANLPCSVNSGFIITDRQSWKLSMNLYRLMALFYRGRKEGERQVTCSQTQTILKVAPDWKSDLLINSKWNQIICKHDCARSQHLNLASIAQC
jgi:hypothetical protein